MGEPSGTDNSVVNPQIEHYTVFVFSNRMQVQKEDIRSEILKAARKEFFSAGYKAASMRAIAQKSGVGLSNMYNYFRNKDEILAEVLHPLMDELERIAQERNDMEFISLDIFTSPSYQRDSITLFMNLIKRFRKELNLLLFHSHGSRYENFRESFTAAQTKEGIAYIAAMKKTYPDINTNITQFFIHNVSAWWLSTIGEIVSHKLSEKETEEFLADYMAFATAGWKKLLNA